MFTGKQEKICHVDEFMYGYAVVHEHHIVNLLIGSLLQYQLFYPSSMILPFDTWEDYNRAYLVSLWTVIFLRIQTLLLGSSARYSMLEWKHSAKKWTSRACITHQSRWVYCFWWCTIGSSGQWSLHCPSTWCPEPAPWRNKCLLRERQGKRIKLLVYLGLHQTKTLKRRGVLQWPKDSECRYRWSLSHVIYDITILIDKTRAKPSLSFSIVICSFECTESLKSGLQKDQ